MIPLLVPLLGSLIDKIFPDADSAAKAKLELIRMQQAGELAQMDINKVEAGSSNFFVAGWRPFIGWLCGGALFAKAIIFPVLFVISEHYGKVIVLPPIDTSELMTLLFALLGIGGLRTVEKIKGVSK